MNENLTTLERNGTVPTVLPDEAQGESTGFKITKICFYFLILSASTFGNSMVAHIINNTKKMRTASNFLILNLAICDFVTPLLSIVFDFVLEENNYEWIYGGAMCKVLWPAQTYFTCASSLTLAAISLDRYRIIMHPFKIRLSARKICILICLVHVFSLVAVTPYGYVLALTKGSCEENWPKFSYRQTYTFFLFLVQYGLPLIFMIVMYTLAVRELCNTSARIRAISANTPRHIVNKLKSDAKKGKIQREALTSKSVLKRLGALRTRSIWNTQNAKATKMFIVVVVVFAIFMFPNQVVWLWADFGGGINSPNFTKLSIICWLFTYTNCVVNPVIFGVFSKDFYKGFKRIFKSIICCERSALKDSAEGLQFQSITKTGSELTVSNTAYEQCSRKDSNLTFLSVQLCEQTTGFQVEPNKQFEEKITNLIGLPLKKTETFGNGHEKPHQPITSMFKPEGESRHLNDDHLRLNNVRQWNALPHSVSCSETLKNALNSSRETYC